jgi:outer membrane protein TolC
MAYKKGFLIIIPFILFLNKSSSAQETILPDLSSNYIVKLIDTAKANYPKVKSYQNHVNIASSVISQTRASLLSAITVSYVYQPGQTTIDPVSPSTSYFKGFQAGIFLNLGTIISQPYQVHQAKEQLQIAKNDQEEYLINLETEVKKRYYIYLQRVAELKLQINALQDVESSFKDIKYKFEKGEETFENLNKSQGELISHKTAKIQAETNLFLSKADIEELLGTKLENIK